MKLSAVILAGGESRRMGRDKAWLEFEGQPLITRALATVHQLKPEQVFISGRAGADYSALKCPVLLDAEPGFGPVAGIERALQAAAFPLVLILAVDLPKMTSAFLSRLFQQCEFCTGVVPRLNGRLEPLAAIYPQRCHAIARECLAQSRHAVRSFAEACLREKAVREVALSSSDAPGFENWNYPGDVATVATSRS
jgi:molybdopterin-guanine dinucleotide biosynthesis protein A